MKRRLIAIVPSTTVGVVAATGPAAAISDSACLGIQVSIEAQDPLVRLGAEISAHLDKVGQAIGGPPGEPGEPPAASDIFGPVIGLNCTF